MYIFTKAHSLFLMSFLKHIKLHHTDTSCL